VILREFLEPLSHPAKPHQVADLQQIVVYVCSGELHQDFILKVSAVTERTFPLCTNPCGLGIGLEVKSGELAHASCYASEAKGLKASRRQGLDKELVWEWEHPSKKTCETM